MLDVQSRSSYVKLYFGISVFCQTFHAPWSGRSISTYSPLALLYSTPWVGQRNVINIIPSVASTHAGIIL
jgi:hypothetical protein